MCHGFVFDVKRKLILAKIFFLHPHSTVPFSSGEQKETIFNFLQKKSLFA